MPLQPRHLLRSALCLISTTNHQAAEATRSMRAAPEEPLSAEICALLSSADIDPEQVLYHYPNSYSRSAVLIFCSVSCLILALGIRFIFIHFKVLEKPGVPPVLLSRRDLHARRGPPTATTTTLKQIFLAIPALCGFLFICYRSYANLQKISYPGAICITSTGVAVISAGQQKQLLQIPYAAIKKIYIKRQLKPLFPNQNKILDIMVGDKLPIKSLVIVYQEGQNKLEEVYITNIMVAPFDQLYEALTATWHQIDPPLTLPAVTL